MLSIAVARGRAIHFITRQLLCQACGVFAALQIAGRKADGSPVYAVTTRCEICRSNYLHATREDPAEPRTVSRTAAGRGRC